MTKAKCANCRVRDGVVAVPYRDVCPTDRGDEIREGIEWWCEECVEDEESGPELIRG
jgi:hypothetical protein